MPLRNPKSEKFREFIRDHEDRSRRYITQAVEILPKLSDDQLTSFVARVPSFVENPEAISEEKLWLNYGISEEEMFAVATTISTLSPAIVAEEDLEDVIQILAEEKIINNAGTSQISRLLNNIKDIASNLKKISRNVSIARAVLPSFEVLEIAVDIRLRFDDEKNVTAAVPVVVGYLDTDDSDQRIWFQLSKSQLASLKKTVDRAILEMEHAEKIIQHRNICGE